MKSAASKSVTRILVSLAVWGPGLLVMLADTDAGNVVTAAQAGTQWGFRLLALLLLLIPVLYIVQELTVRLGVHTGKGFGELIREQFGEEWAWFAAAGLGTATIGSLVTEFTGVAGIGELYGLPRILTLPLACIALLLIVATGTYRRVERAALVVGLFEIAFFAMAWAAHPKPGVLASDLIDPPITSPAFLYLGAALIGATFNPWMVFYQQSAVVEKRLSAKNLRSARWDTAIGATLTQLLTGAVLVAAAATLAGRTAELTSVGQISRAFEQAMGRDLGRTVFSLGVLGASLVAAVVCSLALAWGVGEIAGYRRSLESSPFRAGWFYAVYAACVVGSATLVLCIRNLIWLNIAAQVLNAFLLPVIAGSLVILAVRALPDSDRLRGARLCVVASLLAVVCVSGVFGGLSGLLIH